MMNANLNAIDVIGQYNYIGVFLTLTCNLSCSYCINKFDTIKPVTPLTPEQWILGLNRIITSPDLPLTLQGGEPSLYPGFYRVINGINPDSNIDLLTNGQFAISDVLEHIAPWRLKRDSPYPSIRVSYHPESMSLDELIEKILVLQRHKYSIGVYAINHPRYAEHISAAANKCRNLGIDFRIKDFLGEHDNQLFGTYAFNYAGRNGPPLACSCATKDLLIAPDGKIYRCHHELYNGLNPLGEILAPSLALSNEHRPCSSFGRCNPCDVKIKNNRFQQPGYCSVDIIFDEFDREKAR